MTMIEINIRQKIEDLITRARALVPDDGQARNHRHLVNAMLGLLRCLTSYSWQFQFQVILSASASKKVAAAPPFTAWDRWLKCYVLCSLT
jgi:hypothetical protein